MALKFVRTEPNSEEEYKQFLADEEDSLCFSEHYDEIRENYRAEEAKKRAKTKYPHREPLINYIPYKRRIMVL